MRVATVLDDQIKLNDDCLYFLIKRDSNVSWTQNTGIPKGDVFAVVSPLS